MRSSFISIGIAIIIGIVIGVLLQTPDTPNATNSAKQSLPAPTDENEAQSASTDNDNTLESLQRQLQNEITARKKLQQQVEQLSQKVAELDTQNKEVTTQTPSPHTPSDNSAENRAWFNQQALIDAGVDATTAENIKARFEKQELEKLYLRDQAIREGWLGSKRFLDEMQALNEQDDNLQKELGDEAYAAYLYATGQPNQVTVQSVLANSSADSAGIQANDQILRYGEQRIYNWRDLRNATTKGNADETVSVDIIRDGKQLQVYVQRGPLGIRMNSTSQAPE